MAPDQPTIYSREAWEAVTADIPPSDRDRHPIMSTLYAEHRYMATLMKLLTEQLTALEQNEPVDAHILYELMQYMSSFPDQYHHPREDMVYQKASERDASLADSVDTLQRDHDYLADIGHQTLTAIAGWRDGDLQAKGVLKVGHEYAASLYRHMSTEEKLIFPEIEQVLEEDDWLELEEEDLLAPVPDPVFGPRVDRQYRNLARKARRSLRRGVEDIAVTEWIGIEAVLEGLELLNMALDNGRVTAREHLSEALEANRDIVKDAREEGELALVPLRCMIENTGRYFGFLRDCGEIIRDTGSDLAELNKGMRQRIKTGLGGKQDSAETT